MKYFAEEPHGNFTEDCLGEAEGAQQRKANQPVYLIS